MTSLPFEDLGPAPIELICEFDEFWKLYPRKVNKLKSITAYNKAVSLASHEEIIAGLRRYITNKPGYADWAHAPTWLNGRRWEDVYEVPGNPRVDPEQVWRDRAAMAKAPWGKHQVCRQDIEECHRRGLLTDEELAEALR